jgi:hypothetical protein
LHGGSEEYKNLSQVSHFPGQNLSLLLPEHTAGVLTTQLQHLFLIHSVLNKGELPEQLKEFVCVIVLIFLKDDETGCNNY